MSDTHRGFFRTKRRYSQSRLRNLDWIYYRQKGHWSKSALKLQWHEYMLYCAKPRGLGPKREREKKYFCSSYFEIKIKNVEIKVKSSRSRSFDPMNKVRMSKTKSEFCD